MSNHQIKLLIIFICITLTGCAGRKPIKIPPDEVSSPEPSPAVIEKEGETKYPPAPEETIKRPSPRDLASRNLMEQGVTFLDAHNPDESIRSLEKAVTISPRIGENYYYLAEAWYMKGNLSQAKEYNSLAAIYLKDDPDWMDRIEEQKVRIEETGEGIQ